MHFTRRGFLTGSLVSLGVGACGTSRTAETVVEAYRFAFTDQPGPTIDRNTVSNLPYASIAAKIGRGPRSLLVLWRVEHEDLHWLSADNAAIVTRYGRVVKTAGLPDTIRDTRFQATDPLQIGLQEIQDIGPTTTREVDLEVDQERILIEIASSFRRVGPQRIEITELEFDTILFEERNQARLLNWEFVNRYWVDPADGFVWRSEQVISRIFRPLEIEVLKPAR